MNTQKFLKFSSLLLAASFVVAMTVSCGNNSAPLKLGNDDSSEGPATEKTETSGCQGPAAPNATVFGAWNAKLVKKDSKGRQIPYDATLTIFGSGQTTYTLTCHYPTTDLTASVTVSTTVTDHEIVYNESSTNSAADSGERCTASITAHSVQYALVGNCLSLAGNKPSVLVRN